MIELLNRFAEKTEHFKRRLQAMNAGIIGKSVSESKKPFVSSSGKKLTNILLQLLVIP